MRSRLIDLHNIQIDDPFFGRYTHLVPDVIIPYQWNVLNDMEPDAAPSHAIRNFRIAAGLEEGDFYGFVFQDSDVAKWLEAAAYSLASHSDEDLVEKMDETIRLLASAQMPDGYLDTYFQIRENGQQFTNLREGHELYCAGHLIEAGTAYYKVTGKRELLDLCCRMADHIVDVFHKEPLRRGIPGHEEIELALVKLYEVTGKESYLDMAAEFLDRRGRKPYYFEEEAARPAWKGIFDSSPDGYHYSYSQSDEPVRIMKKAKGHAVRAVYLYCAMADVACYKGDQELLAACERLYENIVGRQMYITGGIGSSGILERFTTDYDLPNNSAYAESCASIGLALFCRRMAQITGEAKYMDTAETALYNTVLSGIAMDGKSFFYVNPLSVWPAACMEGTSMEHVKPVRQKWFGCACCPPNIARTLASLGEYCLFTGEGNLWMNLFVQMETVQNFSGRLLKMRTETRYPFEGRIRIRFSETETGETAPAKTDEINTLRVRIPGYASSFAITRNSRPAEYETDKGYACVKANFISGDVLEITFDMPSKFMSANPAVRADAGRAALVKGPLVYCLEEQDNGRNLEKLVVDTDAPVRETFEKTILGGTLILQAQGWRESYEAFDSSKLYQEARTVREPVTLSFIPYAFWDNRIPGEMEVWVRKR
ncbi:MAG: glycoside hydrolase family 127 protein [Blautia sp.]|nr:glycoside hydrolase family 127 protein [Blautia sp.]